MRKLLLLFMVCLSSDMNSVYTYASKPLIIAHRGSSGTHPEHTLMAYEKAIAYGADLIECDISVTLDRHLVCLHESWLNETTDVAQRPEFSGRLKSRIINGVEITDWFSTDFTLAELLVLRKKQRFTQRDQSMNGLFKIATFREFLQLSQNYNKPIGIYPELKDTKWVNSLLQMQGTRIEDLLLEEMCQFNLTEAEQMVFIQSFDLEPLQYLKHQRKIKFPLVLLIDKPIDSNALQKLKPLLYAIGVSKHLIIDVWTASNGYKNRISKVTDQVKIIHESGLKAHVYTFRNEHEFLAWDFEQDPIIEYQFFMKLGVDGFFTDFPGTIGRLLRTEDNNFVMSALFNCETVVALITIVISFYVPCYWTN